MNTLPPDFVSEAERALASQDRAHLTLQSLEVEGLPWESAGKTFIENLLAECSASVFADRVVLFAGHRIDEPDRKTPRFPLRAEPLAHEAIRDVVIHEQQQGEVTGIAGGANGGDILFLENCHDLGIPYEMLLVLPEPVFIQESVAAQSGNWEGRFQSLASEVRPHVLAESKELPAWLKEKAGYSIWARNNFWMIASALALSPRNFTLIALWDGAKGDGPGGTDHMVQMAQQKGAKFIHLNTRELFAGTGVTRTAMR